MVDAAKTKKGSRGILVRCTPSEHQKIREKARRDRRSLSAYIITVVMDHINKPLRDY